MKLKELLDWRGHIGRRVRVDHRTIDGDHYYIHEGISSGVLYKEAKSEKFRI